MRRLSFIAVALVLTVTGVSTVGPAGAASTKTFVVDLRSDADTSRAAAIARAYGGRATHIYDSVVGGFAFEGTQQAADRLARDRRVELVEPDKTYRAMSHGPKEDVPHLERTDVYEAHDAGYRGAGATIAMLDTGIDRDHPAFQAHNNIQGGKSCVGGRVGDREGHGTASASNAVGKIGVAHEAELVPVKVFPGASLSTSLSALICGLNWVRKHNARMGTRHIDVANMSVAGPGSAALKKAVKKLVNSGVVLTAAAGNTGGPMLYPAAYRGVVSVTALAGGKRIAPFSARGGKMTAPGTNIYSAENGGGYSIRSGTSRSAPMVAGAAAIIFGEDDTLTVAEVRSLLRTSGECPNGDINGSPGFCSGKGKWKSDDRKAEPMMNAYCAGVWAGPATDLDCGLGS